MKLPLERVITLSADSWAVFFVIVLENLAFWKGKIRWSSKELREKKNRYLNWEEMDVERNQKWPFPGSLPSLPFAPLCLQRGPALVASPHDIIGSQLNVCTENATVTARLFLYWKSRNQLLGTPSEEMWFPNKTGMLDQKSFWNFSIWHETWWMVWVFPKLLEI